MPLKKRKKCIMNKTVLYIAIPDGNLTSATEQLFSDSNIPLERFSPRDYKPGIRSERVNAEIIMMKSQEVPDYVASGDLDLGITGYDRIEDWRLGKGASDPSERDLLELRDLEFGVVQTILAVPESLEGVDSFESLIERFPNCRFAGEYVNIMEQYLVRKGYHNPNMRLPNENKITDSPFTIIYSWGATEAKPPKLADAIVENIETQHTLAHNKLKVVDTVLPYSSARLVANKQSLHDRGKATMIGCIERQLMSIVNARASCHLYMNVPAGQVDDAIDILPSINSPTISACHDPGVRRIDAFIPRKKYEDIKSKLLGMGATDLVPESIGRIDIDPLPPRIYEEVN